MGLDMNMYAVKTAKQHPSDIAAIVCGGENQQVDYIYFDGTEPTELAYWRKFNALHGWMDKLYTSKGGTDVFNCIALPLTTQDLQALEEACKSKALVPVTGFFFGSREPVTDEEYQDVLNVVEEARAYINQGYAVYYYSWW